MTMQRHDVDGVPTLLVPHSGPMVAGLVFRVGQADETLPYRGITHLLEHLALHGQGPADHHYNGSTGAIATSFHLQGGEDDIVSFLGGVCGALLDPPVVRLETERSILRTEAAGRNGGVNEMLPLWRHGARDHGLVSYAELGVGRISAEDLRQWAATWFTRQNAVLWIAGDRVPAGLRLPLRDGVRRPVPAASSALPSTPAYFEGPEGHVVFDGVLRRRVAGSVLSGVLERELFRSLRQEDGNSYMASASYDPRGDGYAVVTAFADAAPDKQSAVLGGFLDVLAKVKVGRIDQADLDAVRAKAADSLGHPAADAGRLAGQALNLLTGQPMLSSAQLLDELRAVTVADVHEAALEVLNTGLLQVPEGHTADWAGYVAAPTHSQRVVAGQPCTSRRDPKVSLVVGAEGVSLVHAEHADRPSTVLYRECAVCLAYPDGARQLIGHDGMMVRIEPTIHPVPPEAARVLDAVVAAVTVPMPARNPASIPQPAPEQPAGAPAGGARNTGRLVGAVIAFVLSVVALCCGGLWTWVVADDSDPELDIPLDAVSIFILIVTYGGMLALIGLGVYRLRKRPKT
jgi:zinc protease